MRLEAILKRIAKQFEFSSRMDFGIDNDLIKSETLKLDDNNKPISRHQSRAWPFACLAFCSTDYRKKRDCS